MPNQIFKESVPNDIFFSFLDTICYQKTDKYYIVDKSSYKKSEFTKDLERFCQIIKPYYHISKINYIERTIHYTNFLTLIRQICKYNDISYESKIKYDKSNYEIYYYIYIKDD